MKLSRKVTHLKDIVDGPTTQQLDDELLSILNTIVQNSRQCRKEKEREMKQQFEQFRELKSQRRAVLNELRSLKEKVSTRQKHRRHSSEPPRVSPSVKHMLNRIRVLSAYVISCFQCKIAI